MGKNRNYAVPWDEHIEQYLKSGEFLGSGHNGIVYLLPDRKIIKIFNKPNVCIDEYYILKKVMPNKYFPQVYDHRDYYIVREYVGGKRLDKYLRNHDLNKTLAINLINLIKEFKKLKFKKLDIRCKDLYVQDDMSVKIIDPKRHYHKRVAYPRHLMKGLYKRNQLDYFLNVVKDEAPALYPLWQERMYNYLHYNIK